MLVPFVEFIEEVDEGVIGALEFVEESDGLLVVTVPEVVLLDWEESAVDIELSVEDAEETDDYELELEELSFEPLSYF